MTDDDAPCPTRLGELLLEKLPALRRSRAATKRRLESAGDRLRVDHDDVDQRRVQSVVPGEKSPLQYALRLFDFCIGIGRPASRQTIGVYLRIAVIVISKHRIDRNVKRTEMFGDLGPLRIVDRLDPAGIEVVAGQKNRVYRILALHA